MRFCYRNWETISAVHPETLQSSLDLEVWSEDWLPDMYAVLALLPVRMDCIRWRSDACGRIYGVVWGTGVLISSLRHPHQTLNTPACEHCDEDLGPTRDKIVIDMGWLKKVWEGRAWWGRPRFDSDVLGRFGIGGN